MNRVKKWYNCIRLLVVPIRPKPIDLTSLSRTCHAKQVAHVVKALIKLYPNNPVPYYTEPIRCTIPQFDPDRLAEATGLDVDPDDSIEMIIIWNELIEDK